MIELTGGDSVAFLMPAGLVHSPAVRLLAKGLGCDLEVAQGRYWQLLDFVFGQAKDGSLADIPPTHVAVVLSWDKPAAELYPFLVSVGVIEDGSLLLVGHEEMTRNYREAERKRASRQNAKNPNGSLQGGWTFADASAHVPDASGQVPDVAADRRKEGRKEGAEASATPSATPENTFALFPVNGEGPDAPPWPLTEGHVKKLEEAWEGIDVRGELRKLHVLITTGARNKHARQVYPRAIGNWLTQAAKFGVGTRQPSRASGGGSAPPSRNRPIKPFDDGKAH